jgi:amino acid adenylation domain-containing protein/non-ribosomal peptide synthase protein (TIGR01720 family)
MSDQTLNPTAFSQAKRELLALLLKKEGVKTNSIEKISRRQDATLYPLSFAQERMCFFETFESGTNAYNVASAVRLRGRLDVGALEASFTEILRRHEVLRAVFQNVDTGSVQSITPSHPMTLPVTDLRALPEESREAEALRRGTEEASAPFDLAQGPLLRAHLLQLDADDFVLLLTMHHIASDAWSINVLVREMAALYPAFSAGHPSPLAELPVQYADFANWQRERMRGDALAGGLAYWRRQLDGANTILNLQTDRPRPSAQGFRGAKQTLNLSPELAYTLKELGREENATLFMTLLAAFQTLLHRYTGQTDILTGAPVANRQHRELEPLIGFFLNTLVMRGDFTGDPTFRELLGRIREASLGAFAHQELPFEKLVDELQPERDLSRHPIFQAAFALRNTQQQDLTLAGLTLQPLEVETGTAKFDLMLYIDDAGDELRGSLEYNIDLFEAETAARMAEHFETLLTAVAADPDVRVSDLPLLTEAERRRVLVEWNDTAADYPRGACLHQLFEAQAVATPDITALSGWGEELSYRELNERANRLAAYLRERGTGPDMLVGLLAERGVETLVGMLAILKAGGACVPIDPGYPRDRVEFMLADARINILLTQERLVSDLPPHTAEVVCLDSNLTGAAQGDGDNPGVEVNPNNLLYVLYTSGSTGRPKGVAMTHRPLVNLIAWQLKHQSARPADRTLQFTSLSFDVSFQEIFTTWCSGGTLVLISDDDRRDSTELLRILSAEKINRLFLPFIALQQLAEAASASDATPSHLTEVITAGEQLQITQAVGSFFERLPGCPLFNHYGPTEAHVVSSHTLEGSPAFWPALPPIGRPVANTQLFVLDRWMNPVPSGAPGELYLGGVALARGYLNRPELTAERFVPDPHSATDGARLYRTGDLARFLPDGSVECLGRIDGQVKIRGFRVEVGEIEAVLSEHPSVAEAVVNVREDTPGDKRLVAYVVAVGGDAPEGVELRRFAKEKLPEYMVPSAFVCMERLPLTPSGKVDRRALPAPERESFALAGEFAAPRNTAEEMLARLWSELLGVSQVGIHDNFFELGGDSILTIQVVARAKRSGLRLTPKQLFQHQTVAELAAVIDSAPAISAEQGEVTGVAPLTPIQRWFFEHDFAETHHWNMAYAFEPRRAVDVNILERALMALLSHHDALRLRFTRTEQGWSQSYAPHREDPFLEVISLAGLSPDEQAAMFEREATRLQSTIDLDGGRLLRAAWFDYGAGEPGRLFLVAHHLCVDGISWRVLAEDLQRVYEELEAGREVQLPAKTTSWREWAVQLEQKAASAEASAEIGEWLDARRLAPAPLPVDFPAGDNVEGSAHILTVALDEEETESLLRDVPKVFQARINDVLLTALARSCARWTGSPKLLLDLEGHGREDVVEGADISRTVGWFTNIAPVSLELEDARDLRQSLNSIAASLRRVPHNGVGYGLLRYLSPHAELRESLRAMPRAEVSFNYMGQVDQSFGGAAMFKPLTDAIGPTLGPQNALPHLLYVNGIIFEGRLRMRFKFSENTYRRATIEALANDYLRELRLFVSGSRAPEATRYTPEDFPLARLDEGALAKVVAQVGFAGEDESVRAIIDDIYTLSPAQEGILFHSLYDAGSEVYSVQILCALGGLNVEALERAWQSACERHAILRTAFVWEGLDRPLQVVGRRARLPLERRDLRGLTNAEQDSQLETFLLSDRARGYELARAPLMRLALLQTGDDSYQFVWSQHHLLLDGWSISLVLKEVFTLYAAYNEGDRPVLDAPPSFGDYIGWLQDKKLSDAEEFWRRELAGYTPPSGGLSIGRTPAPGAGYSERFAQLPVETTARLRSLARENQLTLNTIVQGAWAVLLGHYTGAHDVVFGATASGRPAGLDGVESMVGLFINVLPLRAHLPQTTPMLAWLKELQRGQFEVRQYEYTPLSQIQKWSDVPSGTPIFQTVLSFENYPVDESLREHVRSLEITNVRTISRTNYQITIVVTPDERLGVRVVYDGSRFESAAIDQLLENLTAILARFAERPETPLGEIEATLVSVAKKQRVEQQQQNEKRNLSRFKQIKPKAVSLPRGELVKTGLLPTGETLPLVVEPSAAGVDLIDWATGAREEIVGHLLRHGSVLFRGFAVNSVNRFEQFARAICPELFGEYGDLPREGQGGKVYGSTPYPADKAILFHNESSHLHRWPMRIWFYCVTAAERGGETPIVDCREVYRLLSPRTRERFAAKGLLYVRNYIEGLDVSWQDFFRTTDRAVVEELCRKAGARFEWRGDNWLRTSEVRQAVAEHPATGEAVFFNQIQLHHVACLEPDIRESLARTFPAEDFPRNVYYGDGTPIEESVVQEVTEAYERAASRFLWQEGDILLLDNMLAAHSRSPYVGARKIVVAMGDMVSSHASSASAAG